MRSYVTEEELAEALQAAQRLEVSLLLTKIERLNAVVREHGIPLPGDDPRLGASDGDHLAACRQVVTTAYDLLEAAKSFEVALAELRTLVGSGMELVGGAPWKPAPHTPP